MSAKRSWNVRFRLTRGSLKVLKVGDRQPLTRIEAELAAGRVIWLRGHVSLHKSGLRVDGTGDRDLFRGRILFVNTDSRAVFRGDSGPFTSNIAIFVGQQEFRLHMSRRDIGDLREAAARPWPRDRANEA
jgi:hypothetical protein